MVASNERLPYRSNMFDAVISVAVVHHFSTSERRQHAINDLYRICRPGGKVLIYVWAFEQVNKKTGKQRFSEQDVFIPWHMQKQFEQQNQKKQNQQKKDENNDDNGEENGETEEKKKNYEYDEARDEKVYKRYYHLFRKGELETLVQNCSDLDQIVDVHYEADNWIVVGRKK